MTLQDWMRANRFSARVLSEMWDEPEVTIKSWVYGQRCPRPEAQLKIEKRTGGCVKPAEWSKNEQTKRLAGNENLH